MNRAELHSIPGFHPPTLIATAAYLRANMKRKCAGTDPTTLINNEGRINGFLDAVDAMIEVTTKQPEKAEKKDTQPYSAPASQTQNQK
jgi:hypothetical protein